MADYLCEQCGADELTLADLQFNNGVCESCNTENRLNVIAHEHENARWAKMTDTQRDKEINWAAYHG